MRASGKRCSAVWFLNQDSPRMHARLVSTIFSPSACSSMSSQTQPQKVHVAFLTIVKLISGLVWFVFAGARTGRHQKRSAQHAPTQTAADAPRHIPADGDLLPRG